MPIIEKRRAVRVPCQGTAMVTLASGQARARIGNLSCTGILLFIPTTEVRIGQRLSMVFSVPCDGARLWVDTFAVVTRLAHEFGEPAYGLRFEALAEETSSKLKGFVQEQLRARNTRAAAQQAPATPARRPPAGPPLRRLSTPAPRTPTPAPQRRVEPRAGAQSERGEPGDRRARPAGRATWSAPSQRMTTDVPPADEQPARQRTTSETGIDLETLYREAVEDLDDE